MNDIKLAEVLHEDEGYICWKVGNHILEFMSNSHEYFCDSIKVPSVTQILSGRYDDYAGVSKEILERAAKRGTDLHRSIELFEKNGEKDETQELKNYILLKKHFKINNVANEMPVIFEYKGKIIFAGTLDQLATTEGKYGINDFKRVLKPNKTKIAEQLGLYKLGVEQCYGIKIEWLSFMQLREDTRRFFKMPINDQLTIELIDKYLEGEANGK